MSRSHVLMPRPRLESDGGALLANGLSDRLQASIARYSSAARAPNSTRTYATQMRAFRHWCDNAGLSSREPVAPEVVAAWLAFRADSGCQRSTIGVGLAAVQAAHRDRGYAFDVDNPILTATVTGIRRTLLTEPQQVAPLTGPMLRGLLASPRNSLASMRDAALLSGLYLFALRRSEMAGLDVAEHGDGTGILRIGPDSLSVLLLASKGSPNSPALTVIPRASNPRAVDAIEQWITEAALPVGQPFMRRLDGQGRIGGRISGGGVAFVIKASIARHWRDQGWSAAAAEQLARRFSGHSGRVGLVVTATEARASNLAIAAVTRHRSLDSLRRYAEQADPLSFAAHATHGVGV